MVTATFGFVAVSHALKKMMAKAARQPDCVGWRYVYPTYGLCGVVGRIRYISAVIRLSGQPDNCLVPGM